MSNKLFKSAVIGSGVKALCMTVWSAGMVVADLFDNAADILLNI